MSRPREPVETTWMPRSTSASPIFMIEPLPNCFSICERAAARALALFSSILGEGFSGVVLMTLSIGIIPSIEVIGRSAQVPCGLPCPPHETRHHTENLQAPLGANDRVGLVRGLQDERAFFSVQ